LVQPTAFGFDGGAKNFAAETNNPLDDAPVSL
jgi:hypothetical protein